MTTRYAALFCTALLPGILWAAAPVEAERETKTQRVYLMGSSLTDQVNYRGLQGLAESRGYEHVYGRHMVPGAPIRWLWSHPESGYSKRPFGPCGPALAEHEWDALTLEPRGGYNAELQAANELIRHATKRSPDLQVYIFAQWPRIGRGSFDRQWLSDEKDIQNNIRLGFESFLTDVRAAHPDIKPPRMIPVGHAMHLLQLKIEAGLVPGMTSIFDGYSDRSHQNYLGEYIVGCTFFATIYGESPVGLPTEPYGPIDPALARTIQETVWEAVNAHSHSGVKEDGNFRIITPYLPDAVEGGRYDRELHSAFGKSPVRFSLAAGSLPRGISVDPEGRISGVTDGVGTYEFTVAAVDEASDTATRRFELTCSPESVPVIREPALPAIRQGRQVSYPLTADGGNGEITWRVVQVRQKVVEDGQERWQPRKRAGKPRMPAGLELTYTGELVGSPALAGTFEVTVAAEDADPSQPDVAKKTLELEIAEAGPEVIRVLPTSERMQMDGRLTEASWKLDREVARKVWGSPSCEARFGVVWGSSHLFIAVEVQDETITEDSDQPWDDDGVEIFFDMLNDRQKEYNADDKRLVVSASGETYAVGFEEKDFDAAATRTETGHIVEVRVRMPRRNRPHRVYGFDVAVNDDDNGGPRDGQLVWQGSANNATDPSEFGAVLFMSGED